jgi:hypothetical protein
MAEHHLLRSRNAAATRSAPAPVVAESSSNDLALSLEYANAIANAGSAVLPAAYRGKPGAVLLAREWALARGVDMLTALQTVAFVEGKPVIDATMQRALAVRAGYTVKVESSTDGEVESWSGTVTIGRPGGEVLGSATYSWSDAKRAGLADRANWRKNPEDMLVARATSRAMRRHAPEVMVGVFAEDELEPEPTPAELAESLTSAHEVPAEVEPEVEVVDQADEPEVHTETGPASASRKAAARKRARKAPARKNTAPEPETELATVAGNDQVHSEHRTDAELDLEVTRCTDATWQAVVALGQQLDDEDTQALKSWVTSRGWQLRQDRLSEAQARAIVEWSPR